MRFSFFIDRKVKINAVKPNVSTRILRNAFTIIKGGVTLFPDKDIKKCLLNLIKLSIQKIYLKFTNLFFRILKKDRTIIKSLVFAEILCINCRKFYLGEVKGLMTHIFRLSIMEYTQEKCRRANLLENKISFYIKRKHS